MENYEELLKRNEIVYKEYQKSVKHMGEVYAVLTKKGYAIAQIAGINYHGGEICRIFSNLYQEIPNDIQSIIYKKEDYLTNIVLSSMAHWRVNKQLNWVNTKYQKTFKYLSITVFVLHSEEVRLRLNIGVFVITKGILSI